MDKNKQLYEKQSNQYNPFFPIVRLEDIIETISDKSIQWILNNYNHIYVEYSESVAITRNKVPSLLRRNGLWISYNNGKKIITEHYIGSNTDVHKYSEWTDDANWHEFKELREGAVTYQHLSIALKQLLAEGNNTITNFPDEEDITTDGIVLSFKDREYDTTNFSGLGKVILRKNIILVDGVYKNVLTQNMINKSNTVYEIRYDFDLNGEEITILEGCVLDFQGGSFSNGEIVGTNTRISSAPVEIYSDIKLIGTWDNVFYVEWFGFKNNGTNNDTHKFQEAINNSTIIELLPKTYKIGAVIIKKNTIIKGNNSTISPNGEFESTMLLQLNSDISLSNIIFDGMVQYYPTTDVGWRSYIGINADNAQINNICISNCKFYNCSGHFINFTAVSGTNSFIRNVNIYNCTFSNKGVLQNLNHSDAVRYEISDRNNNYGEICFENITISNCNAEYIRTLADYKRGCNYGYIINCFTHNMHDCHHSIDGSFNCVIENCYGYMDSDFNPNTGTNFIEIQGENITIKGCKYNGNYVTQRGFQITDYARPQNDNLYHLSKNIQILNNYIENCSANGFQISMLSGIVENNILKNINYHGISIVDATTGSEKIPVENIVVKGNNIINAELSYNIGSENGHIYFYDNYENNILNPRIYITQSRIIQPAFYTKVPNSLITNPYLYINYNTGRLINSNTGSLKSTVVTPPIGIPNATALYSDENSTGAVILNDKINVKQGDIIYISIKAKKDCEYNPVIVINERGADDSWIAYKNFSLPLKENWEQYIFSYKITNENISYAILQILPTGTNVGNTGYNSFTELVVSKEPIGLFTGLINSESYDIRNNYTGVPYQGQCKFDTSLNKPIWWTGEKWVDATGTDV